MSAVMMGSLMQMIDTSIVNVAIPTMQGNLGATLDQITWVSTGYILANVIVLPMTGWLSSVFGRRKYLAGSMVLFTAASFFCGTSRSLEMLVFFRIMQGIGGAALMSTAQATMLEIFPPHQLAMTQAVFSMTVMVGPAVGPTLGGWITDNYNWPWIFFINVPIGIVASLVTLAFMRDSAYARARKRIDFLGIVLLAVGLGCLQTLLEKGTRENWFDSELIVWLTVLAVVGLTAFTVWELRVPHPVVNLRVLRHRGFTAGTILATVVGFGLFGGIFVLPVFLQSLRHYTAMQSGILMLPGALSSAVAMPIVGRLVRKASPRVLAGIGMIGSVASMFLFHHLTLDSGPADIFWPMVLRGAAMGFMFLPMTLAALTGLHGHEIAEGTALFNLSRQLGGSAGIAYLSTFLLHRQSFHYTRLIEGLTVYNPVTRQWLHKVAAGFMAAGSPETVARQQALAALAGNVQRQAAVMSYDDIFLLMSVVFVAAMSLLLLFERGSAVHERMRAPAAE
jgi:DHA2 family multidrug resistance protein